MYETALSVLQDVSLISNGHLPHPMVSVPSLCFLLSKPFESFPVYVADVFQRKPLGPSLSSEEDHPECFASELVQLTAVVCW